MKLEVRPLGKRILVAVPRDTEHQTSGGIVMPESVESPTAVATVLAVGPKVQCGLAKDDCVVMGRFKGERVNDALGHDIRESDWRIVPESEILGKVVD